MNEPFFVYVEGKQETPALELIDSYSDVAEKLFSSTRFYRAKRDSFPKAVIVPEVPSVLVFKDNDYWTYVSEGDEFTGLSSCCFHLYVTY